MAKSDQSKMIAALVGIVSLSSTLIGVGVWLGSRNSASASEVRAQFGVVDQRLTKVETVVGVQLPSMDHKLDLLIEAAQQEALQAHRFVIPSPKDPH